MRFRISDGAMMFGRRRRGPRPDPRSRAGPRARAVIVGARFGGLECAHKLDGAAVDVIRIIVQTPPDPIVATLRSPDPDEKRAVPAETRDGGRAR